MPLSTWCNPAGRADQPTMATPRPPPTPPQRSLRGLLAEHVGAYLGCQLIGMPRCPQRQMRALREPVSTRRTSLPSRSSTARRTDTENRADPDLLLNVASRACKASAPVTRVSGERNTSVWTSALFSAIESSPGSSAAIRRADVLPPRAASQASRRVEWLTSYHLRHPRSGLVEETRPWKRRERCGVRARVSHGPPQSFT